MRSVRYYNVNPRYSAGSPAMVDAATARRVAVHEKDEYKANLEGIYGEEAKAEAEKRGLKGIVECVIHEQRRHRKDGHLVYDLLTEEEYWRPRPGAVATCVEPSDHEILPTSLHLAVRDDGVVIVGRCKHCNGEGETVPLTMTWP